jgi:chorismate mutase|tara:strand:- start:1772 stop:1963 length:192 start_codon:yes stop_codon:yes gene_type:complete
MDLKNQIEKWVAEKLDDPATRQKVIDRWNEEVNIPILNEKTEEKIFAAIYDSAVAVIKKVLIK